MFRPLRTKTGVWAKPGNQGSDSQAPGSYGGYLYFRNAPASYPKTSQQRAIGDAGRKVAGCKGKSGIDFRGCRSAALASVRKGA